MTTETTTYGIKDVLLEQFKTEATAFVKALDGIDDEVFETAPSGGGHSPAWHALHIAEWTRLLLSDLAGEPAGGTFGFLGWEDQAWVKKLTGPTEATEQDGKPIVMYVLNRTFSQIGVALSALASDRFTPDAKLRTPIGERPLIASVTGTVRHIAYHRGQVKIGQVHG
ncbi:DinB family protein [Deinococcus yavapaiensis]|uniref:DinB family protein n=1 Tax=Deinococcus yavapaiensis KR-236 TaxID=694435 RepID=A0A318SC14_9DEIO|nr:DinB family protein [Deinococcus yavapaiensis]PYE55924.1 DinB family protein [Deinococcus yavapaiensis KR-236]